jgi:diacylglycerol kinase family enzyme
VNGTAGSARNAESQILATCAAHGIAAQLHWAQSGHEIAELAIKVVAGRPQRVVAGGGDGTLSTVASRLVGTGIELGVLPIGTLNHFAKDLRIPLDLAAAMTTAITGTPVAVDVASVNGQYFLNNSSLGLYPRLVRIRQREQQRIGRNKWTALLWASLVLFRRYSRIGVTLTVDGVARPRRTPLVFVGNNLYRMTGLEIGSRERLDAGTLGVYVPRVLDRKGLLLLALRAFLRSPRLRDDLEMLATREITLTPRRPDALVSVDGEVRRMRAPLHYATCPRALTVVVPPDVAAGVA